MNDISTAELLELRYLLESSIDVQFQVWMAITFAVVVAAYSGRADMTKTVRVAIVCIYLMAAYALLSRWMMEGARIGQIAEVLNERGVSLPYWERAGYARFATYLFGTVIAAISIFYFDRIEKRHEKSAGEG